MIFVYENFTWFISGMILDYLEKLSVDFFLKIVSPVFLFLGLLYIDVNICFHSLELGSFVLFEILLGSLDRVDPFVEIQHQGHIKIVHDHSRVNFEQVAFLLPQL